MFENDSVITANDYFVIDTNDDLGAAEALFKGLASEPRLRILKFLHGHVRSISEIAAALDMPATTVAMHISVLEEAALVRSELLPASRGRQKMVSRSHFDRLLIVLPLNKPPRERPDRNLDADRRFHRLQGQPDVRHCYVGRAGRRHR